MNPLAPFELEPPSGARVSEIGEATAASGVPVAERVNFHIGNPVQDPRLLGLFQRLVVGLPAEARPFGESGVEALVRAEGIDETSAEALRVVCRAVEECVAYLPRGGFQAGRPGRLAPIVHERLTTGAEEPYTYDLGTDGGPREITFANGGRTEALRVLLSALARSLVRRPAHVHTLAFEPAPHLRDLSGIVFATLPDALEVWLPELERRLGDDPERPHVLVIGQSLPETARRALRRLAEDRPLLFVEANDAPNERSLARESGLAERVLRLLTPAAVGARDGDAGDALVVVAGSARFVQAFEIEHFRLKGTPSAAEVEWVVHVLSRPAVGGEPMDPVGLGALAGSAPPVEPPHAFRGLAGAADVVARVADRSSAAARGAAFAERLGERAGRVVSRLLDRSAELRFTAGVVPDPFGGADNLELIRAFFDGGRADPAFVASVERSFLAAFLRHHPEYDPRSCLAVSGSARTALGVLGFHCGVREIITPDLSWTYEHCFPQVHAVPLRPDLHLDGPAIIAAVEDHVARDPSWPERGAVVLNTPHNASGQVFADADLEALVAWLLERGVRVVDDLSYDDVGPDSGLTGRRSIRRITGDLVRSGRMRPERLRHVVTVHSLSKTDCFAGARLAVIEIPDGDLRAKYEAVHSTIAPNAMALLVACLFLRRASADVRGFWALRNEVLRERMDALVAAQESLPADRNPYGIEVRRPAGAMYPQLVVDDLPDGVSLEWLSVGLARRGIGILPLTTFARTARGFDLARRTFRLTLGGRDGADVLERKMRRVLIDLNRHIRSDAACYTRRALPTGRRVAPKRGCDDYESAWSAVERRVVVEARDRFLDRMHELAGVFDAKRERVRFETEFLPERLKRLRGRFRDAAILTDHLVAQASERGGVALVERLERELLPTPAEERERAFRRRTFDRTVHPTQMYAVRVDQRAGALTDSILLGESDLGMAARGLARELVDEFIGSNVRIDSRGEAGELVADLRALLEAEEWARVWHDTDEPVLLSFWGDWDGSTRPSGQGHRLVAGALLADVTQLAELLGAVAATGAQLRVDPALVERSALLGTRNEAFWELLNEITALTSQLEARYQRLLPFDLRVGRLRGLGMRLGVMRSPITRRAQHNDRLERRMLKLRERRRDGLESYLRLDAALRAVLRDNLGLVQAALTDRRVAVRAGWFRDLLRRFVLTPRIHQRMVLASDPFAIDTTVHNLVELNRLACAHGVPGFVLAIQVSQSTDPEAFVVLDRKIRAQRGEALRAAAQAGQGGLALPPIWIIPLFEDADTVRGLTDYLNRLWQYASHSRELGQDPAARIAEMMCEVFVAGSDLSQQVSQPAGAALYREAKLQTVRWLAERGLLGRVRIKLGSGEPAQRQGGYYDASAGAPTVHGTTDGQARLRAHLGEPARRAAETARTPLAGVLEGGELRTWQSNVAEQLRRLRAAERAALLHHVRGQQREHDATLERAAAVLRETRSRFRERGLQELELLTRGPHDARLDAFLALVERNFRHILYGRDEDVVGLHAISYFVSRAVPALRDRPVVRPSRELGQKGGREILGRIALTLPLSRHGSLLRAIGHNLAQTTILGVNQLSTGLFRALSEFVEQQGEGAAASRALTDAVLPRLPVRDLLRTLRLYHDPRLTYVRRMETAFPAGNSAFVALREDNEALPRFVGALQRELVRRVGLHPDEFLAGDHVRPELLPALRPDLAVLLQPDLFNEDAQRLFETVGGDPDEGWRTEVAGLLTTPGEVREMRERVWEILEAPVRAQVESFVELTRAIYTLTVGEGVDASVFGPEQRQLIRLRGEMADVLRGNVDDPMRQFLIAAVQFLTRIPGNVAEVPVEVVRALQDVRRIVRIEEQALGEREQALVRFHVLRVARLCGENG